MIAKLIKKWKSKTVGQKKLFLEAYFYLIYCRIVLQIFPFKKIILYYGMENIKTEKKSNAFSNTDLVNIKWSIAAAVKYLPFQALCLNQALVAQIMLKKRKTSGFLLLGVTKDETEAKGMLAHAWVKCNDKIVTGGNSFQKYIVISTYTWS